MDFWTPEDAEKQFGEVMNRALANTRQTIMFPDHQGVVVMSEKAHHRYVLAVQRLLELGETPPEVPERQEGEMGAWEFIESLPPVDENGEPGFPEGFFEQMREESRHCECCARNTLASQPAEAAD